jgi:hypothetical protein
MKQTAVDFLEEFLKEYDCAHSSLDYYKFGIPMHTFDKKIGQAKEMEKEQIKDAFILGELQEGFEDEAEHYYNETFKSNK